MSSAEQPSVSCLQPQLAPVPAHLFPSVDSLQCVVTDHYSLVLVASPGDASVLLVFVDDELRYVLRFPTALAHFFVNYSKKKKFKVSVCTIDGNLWAFELVPKRSEEAAQQAAKAPNKQEDDMIDEDEDIILNGKVVSSPAKPVKKAAAAPQPAKQQPPAKKRSRLSLDSGSDNDSSQEEDDIIEIEDTSRTGSSKRSKTAAQRPVPKLAAKDGILLDVDSIPVASDYQENENEFDEIIAVEGDENHVGLINKQAPIRLLAPCSSFSSVDDDEGAPQLVTNDAMIAVAGDGSIHSVSIKKKKKQQGSQLVMEQIPGDGRTQPSCLLPCDCVGADTSSRNSSLDPIFFSFLTSSEDALLNQVLAFVGTQDGRVLSLSLSGNNKLSLLADLDEPLLKIIPFVVPKTSSSDDILVFEQEDRFNGLVLVGQQGCLRFLALHENRAEKRGAPSLRFSVLQQDLHLQTRITDALVQDDKFIVLCANGSIRFMPMFFKSAAPSNAEAVESSAYSQQRAAPFLARLQLSKSVIRDFPFRRDAVSIASNDIDELLYVLTRSGALYKVPVPANAAAVDAILGRSMRTQAIQTAIKESLHSVDQIQRISIDREKNLQALNDSIAMMNKATHVAHWLCSSQQHRAEISTSLFGKIDHDGSPMLKVVLANNSSMISLSGWTLLVLLEKEAQQQQSQLLTFSFPLELTQGATWKRRIPLKDTTFIQDYMPMSLSMHLCFANGESAERGLALQLHSQTITLLDFCSVEPVAAGFALLQPANQQQRKVTLSLNERLQQAIGSSSAASPVGDGVASSFRMVLHSDAESSRSLLVRLLPQRQSASLIARQPQDESEDTQVFSIQLRSHRGDHVLIRVSKFVPTMNPFLGAANQSQQGISSFEVSIQSLSFAALVAVRDILSQSYVKLLQQLKPEQPIASAKQVILQEMQKPGVNLDTQQSIHRQLLDLQHQVESLQIRQTQAAPLHLNPVAEQAALEELKQKIVSLYKERRANDLCI